MIVASGREMGYPFTFVVGAGKVIRAWDLVLPTMAVGEIWYAMVCSLP